MAFINQDRKSSIQSDRLNLKQTPADIWEYDDSGAEETPVLSLKSPWTLASVNALEERVTAIEEFIAGL